MSSVLNIDAIKKSIIDNDFPLLTQQLTYASAQQLTDNSINLLTIAAIYSSKALQILLKHPGINVAQGFNEALIAAMKGNLGAASVLVEALRQDSYGFMPKTLLALKVTGGVDEILQYYDFDFNDPLHQALNEAIRNCPIDDTPISYRDNGEECLMPASHYRRDLFFIIQHLVTLQKVTYEQIMPSLIQYQLYDQFINYTSAQNKNPIPPIIYSHASKAAAVVATPDTVQTILLQDALQKLAYYANQVYGNYRQQLHPMVDVDNLKLKSAWQEYQAIENRSQQPINENSVQDTIDLLITTISYINNYDPHGANEKVISLQQLINTCKELSKPSASSTRL